MPKNEIIELLKEILAELRKEKKGTGLGQAKSGGSFGASTGGEYKTKIYPPTN